MSCFFSSTNSPGLLSCTFLFSSLAILLPCYDGNSTMQVDRPQDGPANHTVSAADGDSSSEDLTELRRVEWERAEEKYEESQGCSD